MAIMGSFTYLFIHSFTWQVFIEHLVTVKSSVHKIENNSALGSIYISVEEKQPVYLLLFTEFLLMKVTKGFMELPSQEE